MAVSAATVAKITSAVASDKKCKKSYRNYHRFGYWTFAYSFDCVYGYYW